jgi:hypothetical protein
LCSTIRRPPGRVADAADDGRRIDDVGEEDRREDAIARVVRRLAVPGGVRPLDGDIGLVADHPGVMPGRDLVDVAAVDVHLGPVVHDDVEAPPDRERDVADLAARRPDDRLDVGRPSPARRQRDPADDRLVEIDRFQVPGAERANAIRSGERLALEAGHRRHCRSWREAPDKVRGGPPKRTASMLSR